MQKFPVAIRDFAETFIWLQRRRHLADYDPEFPFCKSEVRHPACAEGDYPFLQSARQGSARIRRSRAYESEAQCLIVRRAGGEAENARFPATTKRFLRVD